MDWDLVCAVSQVTGDMVYTKGNTRSTRQTFLEGATSLKPIHLVHFCTRLLLPRNDRAALDVELNGAVIPKGGKNMPGIPTRPGKQVSATERCNDKYLMHLERRTFSLAQLPQAGCGALKVVGAQRYYTLIECAYRSNGFSLPVQLPT